MLLDYLEQHEASIRFGCFIAVFTVMAIWELISPRRSQQFSTVLERLALVE